MNSRRFKDYLQGLEWQLAFEDSCCTDGTNAMRVSSRHMRKENSEQHQHTHHNRDGNADTRLKEGTR